MVEEVPQVPDLGTHVPTETPPKGTELPAEITVDEDTVEPLEGNDDEDDEEEDE